MAGTIDRGMSPRPAPPVPPPPPRRWPWALAAVIALGAGVWIGRGTVAAPTASQAAAGPAVTVTQTVTQAVTRTVPGPTVTVTQTAPGRTVTVTHTATQPVAAAPPAPASGSTLLTASGSGAYTTARFTIGGSGNWDVQWTYGEGNFGQSVNFSIVGDGGSDFNFTDPNQLGAGGSGVVHVYNDAGTHYLTISSEGNWTIKVVTAP